jgi:ribosomal protein S7
VSSAKEKNNYKLFQNLLEEFQESALKKSLSAKKKNDLHKLAEASLVNTKGKLK